MNQTQTRGPSKGQQPAVPVVGFIHGGAADAFPGRIAAFRVGLSQTGYVEGQNVVIEYHWLEGHFEHLPAVLVDLSGLAFRGSKNHLMHIKGGA